MDTFLLNCEDTWSSRFNQYGYDFKESDSPKSANHAKLVGLTPLAATLIDEYDQALENELFNLQDLKLANQAATDSKTGEIRDELIYSVVTLRYAGAIHHFSGGFGGYGAGV